MNVGSVQENGAFKLPPIEDLLQMFPQNHSTTPPDPVLKAPFNTPLESPFELRDTLLPKLGVWNASRACGGLAVAGATAGAPYRDQGDKANHSLYFSYDRPSTTGTLRSRDTVTVCNDKMTPESPGLSRGEWMLEYSDRTRVNFKRHFLNVSSSPVASRSTMPTEKNSYWSVIMGQNSDISGKGMSTASSVNDADDTLPDFEVPTLPPLPPSPIREREAVESESENETDPSFEAKPSPQAKKLRRKNSKRATKPKALKKDKPAIRRPARQPARKSNLPRSRNGCWTCRLRRKRCPEQKPECSECQRLGLQCDGYSEKKPWFIVSPSAGKQRMEEIKNITISKKGRKPNCYESK